MKIHEKSIVINFGGQFDSFLMISQWRQEGNSSRIIQHLITREKFRPSKDP